MTDKKNSKTRKKILDAACKLFSENGLNSVSTRMIADKAGVHLGSIHYYFDDKEALYLEVFRLALQTDNMINFEKLLKENPPVLDTPESKSALIYLGVKNYFQDRFRAEDDWKRRLILRELSEVSGVAEKLTEELFKPQIEKCRKAYKVMSLRDCPIESFLWTHIPACVASFYLLTQPTLERTFDEKFANGVCSRLSDMTARMMILLLGLPLPPELQHAACDPEEERGEHGESLDDCAISMNRESPKKY